MPPDKPEAPNEKKWYLIRVNKMEQPKKIIVARWEIDQCKPVSLSPKLESKFLYLHKGQEDNTLGLS